MSDKTSHTLIDDVQGVFTKGEISTAQINALLTQFASRSTATAALSVAIVAGISAASSAGMLTFYSLNRRKPTLAPVYFPRQAKLLYDDQQVNLSRRVGGFYGRLISIFKLSFFLPSNRRLQALVDFIGIDSTAYLLHYRLCAVLLFAIALGGSSVAYIDYQYTGSTKDASDILDATSMLRLKGRICWIHCGLAIYSTLCTIILTQTYYLKFYLVRSYWCEKRRREHDKLEKWAKTERPYSDRTWVMVSGGVSHFADVSMFADEKDDCYEIMNGLKVRKTQTATYALNDKVQTFERLATKYLQAERALDAAGEAKEDRIRKRDRLKAIGASKKEMKDELAQMAIQCPRAIVQAKRKAALYRTKIDRLVDRIATDLKTLEKVSNPFSDERYRSKKRDPLECCCGQRKPNIDKLLSQSYGFVLLESNLAARYCVYRLRSKQRFSALGAVFHHFFPRPNAELSPGAGGLDWNNIVKNRVLRVSDTLKGTAALGLTLFAFTVFQILIASLANADSWTTVFPILKEWQSKELLGLPAGKWLFAGLVGGVPPALTAATRSLLPMAVRRLAKIRGARTWAKLVEVCIAYVVVYRGPDVRSWLYIAQVFCQVTAFTLAGTIWVFWSALYKQSQVTGLAPAPLLRTLKGFPREAIQACLHSSNYWLSSFSSSVAMAFFDLMLPFRLFNHYRRTQLIVRKRQLTVRERATNAAPGRDADLDSRAASLLLEIAVVFTYCALSPLISVLGFIAVLVQYRVHHVQLTKVYQPPPETGGNLWRVLTNRLLFSVGVIQPIILAEAMGLEFGWRGVLISCLPALLVGLFRAQMAFNLFGHWRKGWRMPWSLDEAVEWGYDVLWTRELIRMDRKYLDKRFRNRFRDMLAPVDLTGRDRYERQATALYDIKPTMPRFEVLPKTMDAFRSIQLLRYATGSAEIHKSPWADLHGTHPMFSDSDYRDLVDKLGKKALDSIGAVPYNDEDVIEVELGLAAS